MPIHHAPHSQSPSPLACVAPALSACLPARLQLELAAMFRNGDLQNMWEVARKTHLTFNMVRVAGGQAGVRVGGRVAPRRVASRAGRAAVPAQLHATHSPTASSQLPTNPAPPSLSRLRCRR